MMRICLFHGWKLLWGSKQMTLWTALTFCRFSSGAEARFERGFPGGGDKLLISMPPPPILKCPRRRNARAWPLTHPCSAIWRVFRELWCAVYMKEICLTSPPIELAEPLTVIKEEYIRITRTMWIQINTDKHIASLIKMLLPFKNLSWTKNIL